MLAFANGLHTMVIDGDEVYAGMTRLAAVSGPNGTRVLTLPNGLTAQLEPRGGQLVLRFSTGDTVVMRKAGVAEGQS